MQTQFERTKESQNATGSSNKFSVTNAKEKAEETLASFGNGEFKREQKIQENVGKTT